MGWVLIWYVGWIGVVVSFVGKLGYEWVDVCGGWKWGVVESVVVDWVLDVLWKGVIEEILILEVE